MNADGPKKPGPPVMHPLCNKNTLEENMPEDYIPYGPEWEKEMMTMRKKDLVNILKDYFKRHKNIKKIVNDLVAGIEA